MAARTRTYDQLCPVALSLDALGDRWTILILRDLLWRGPHGYQELMDANPGLSPTLLSERLGSLTDQGLIEKVEVRDGRRAAAFRLTGLGKEIEPIIESLYGFGANLMAKSPLSRGKLDYLMWLSAGNLGKDLFELDEYRVRLAVADVDVDVKMSPGRIEVVDPHGTAEASVTLTQDSLMAVVSGASDVELQTTGDGAAVEQLLMVIRRSNG